MEISLQYGRNIYTVVSSWLSLIVLLTLYYVVWFVRCCIFILIGLSRQTYCLKNCMNALQQLREIALTNIGAIEKRADLSKKLSVLLPDEIKDLVCNKVI